MTSSANQREDRNEPCPSRPSDYPYRRNGRFSRPDTLELLSNKVTEMGITAELVIRE